jgi:hypothetical protein
MFCILRTKLFFVPIFPEDASFKQVVTFDLTAKQIYLTAVKAKQSNKFPSPIPN